MSGRLVIAIARITLFGKCIISVDEMGGGGKSASRTGLVARTSNVSLSLYVFAKCKSLTIDVLY